MTIEQQDEVYEFVQKLKAISAVDFVELLKAHIHNGNDFLKIDYSDLKNVRAITRLNSTLLVDMNSATATLLYAVPDGKSCVITHIVVRNASASLNTASYSFGFNSTSFNDIIANATHTELTGATLYTVLAAKVGAKVGVNLAGAGNLLKVLMNTLQGGAATTTIDVYGYLF